MYFVLALSEVTNTESGVSVGGADTITFGNIYWGGKLCIFDSTNHWKVTGLKDESTGEISIQNNGDSIPVEIHPKEKIYIPELILDGKFSIKLTGKDDEIEVPFSPILAAGYSEPVVLIEL